MRILTGYGVFKVFAGTYARCKSVMVKSHWQWATNGSRESLDAPKNDVKVGLKLLGKGSL